MKQLPKKKFDPVRDPKLFKVKRFEFKTSGKATFFKATLSTGFPKWGHLTNPYETGKTYTAEMPATRPRLCSAELIHGSLVPHHTMRFYSAADSKLFLVSGKIVTNLRIHPDKVGTKEITFLTKLPRYLSYGTNGKQVLAYIRLRRKSQDLTTREIRSLSKSTKETLKASWKYLTRLHLEDSRVIYPTMLPIRSTKPALDNRFRRNFLSEFLCLLMCRNILRKPVFRKALEEVYKDTLENFDARFVQVPPPKEYNEYFCY
jgi:hypothetical protein